MSHLHDALFERQIERRHLKLISLVTSAYFCPCVYDWLFKVQHHNTRASPWSPALIDDADSIKIHVHFLLR